MLHSQVRLGGVALTLLVAVGLVALGLTGRHRSGSGPKASSGKVAAGEQVSRLLQAGANAQQAQDIRTALGDYQAALKISPTNADASYNLGDLLQAEGNDKAALKAYDAALASAPDFTSAMFNKAVLLTPTQPMTAEALFRRILTLQPDAATTYLNLGLLLVRQGSAAEGKADIAQAVRLLPSLRTAVPAGLQPPSLSLDQTAVSPSRS